MGLERGMLDRSKTHCWIRIRPGRANSREGDKQRFALGRSPDHHKYLDRARRPRHLTAARLLRIPITSLVFFKAFSKASLSAWGEHGTARSSMKAAARGLPFPTYTST